MVYEDVRVEQLVKHKPTFLNILIKFAAILLGLVVTATAWLITPRYSYILFTAAWIAAYFIFITQSYEYEYIYDSGDLYIDKIVAKRRRTRAIATHMDQIELFAPCDDAHANLVPAQGLESSQSYCTSKKAQGRWFFLIPGKTGGKIQVIFEPGARMQETLQNALRGKAVQ